MRTAAFGVPWLSVDMLKPFLKTKWKLLEYTQNKMTFEDVLKQNPEGIVSFSPPEDLLSHSSVKWIISPGAGVDAIDTTLIKKRGQKIINTHGNSSSVAEHAWSLLMASSRNLVKYDTEIRSRNDWPGSQQIFDMNVDLRSKTIGIIGYGAIGKKMEKYAHAFDMEVMIFRNNAEEGQHFDYELEEQAGNLDFLVIACPLTSKTKGLVSEKVIKKLPSHLILVNVARGAIIDEKALFNALREGDLRAAGIDTWQNSPYFGGESGNKPKDFSDIPNLLISPHRAWVSKESFVSSLQDIAQELDLLAKGKNSSNEYDFENEY